MTTAPRSPARPTEVKATLAAPDESGPPAAEAAEEVLRAWVEKGLHEAYDTVRREALPERILQLIAAHRRDKNNDGGNTPS